MGIYRINVYSRYVRLMKVILPVSILLSIGLALGWPYLLKSGQENLVKVDANSPEIKDNHMVNPHYVSTDNKGQPFHLTAESAIQSPKKDYTDLQRPKGSITTVEGETFNVDSKTGHYDAEKKLLTLEQDVTLTSTDGYHIKTEKAHINVDGKTIEGDDFITGSGPAGEIMGEKGFKVESHEEGKKVLTLKGRSRVVIAAQKEAQSNEN